MQLIFGNNPPEWLTFRKALPAALALFLFAPALSTAVSAQTLNERLAARQQNTKQSRMVVDAREVVYDRDRDRVSAVGDVQILYQGRTLQADRVTYDRKNRRVYAEGNARLTEADGTKSFSDRFDLTDDFRDGFIDSLRVETPNKTRFSAARAERTGGEQTVFDRGTFTACEPCKDNPEKPPLWQVKAARIIHNNSEQRIYYENASIEFWGVPVAWFPYFASPDPTVSRLSGVLSPRFISRTRLGYGASLPVFWALAPNYDLTVTPSYFSRQGFHGDALWRHRTENGSYNIRINGIFQQDRRAFDSRPFAGAGDKTFRGSIASRGKFYLNEKWTFGWDGAIATDKFYFTDYKVKPSSLSNTYFTESISKIYFQGRGERSWFDLSAYHFLGLSTTDWQPQIGNAVPSFDFDRRFTPDALGGELKLTANMAAINRDAAFYQPLPLAGGNFVPTTLLYNNNEGQYYACRYTSGGVAVGNYTPGQCLLRGFAGQYVRSSVDLSWRRQFIDPVGQVWTPFVGLRGDLAFLQVRQSGYNAPNDAFGGAGYGNDKQAAFFGGNADNYLFRGMPSIGIEYRYPFFAMSSFGTHHIEPIAQLIVRPNEQRIGKLPNEDAQSLVFDENSIFSLNKFSGYDRVEGGTRLNYGGRYSFSGNNGTYASVLFGQSIHLYGRNSYAQYDLANTGRNSGLEGRQSHFVAAATVQPNLNSAFTVRGRFDEKSLGLKRLDVEGTTKVIERVHLTALYSRIAPQPELGYTLRREGVYLKTHIDLPKNFYATGSVLFDLDRYLTQKIVNPAGNTSPWSVSGTMLGVGYKDECTDLSLTYSRTYNDYLTGTNQRTTTYMMRLELRELGETSIARRTTR
ncbi:MAG: LPS-assembly protein LptD [Beijerinckiaceae bacterium]|nr:LPS-assembly protein LptD [Beijerinckiaceae bacterium]MCZ8299877.1 LPS-assembly protein LptD [Beijerinckiaceae bacterium]